jgi:NADH:ubiquinone oxidoreductase subunit E
VSVDHVSLLVCVGPRCDAEGRGRALLARAEAALQHAFPEELAQGRLRISTRDCLRHCTSEPVVRLEPSGEAFAGPDIETLLREIRTALHDALSSS